MDYRPGQIIILLQTFLVYDHTTRKGPELIWLLSVSSMDFLPVLGHRGLGSPYSVC